MDLLLNLCLVLTKVSNLALLIVNCLVLHLELMSQIHLQQMKELSWVPLMFLMVPIKAFRRVHFLGLHLDLLMVFVLGTSSSVSDGGNDGMLEGSAMIVPL